MKLNILDWRALAVILDSIEPKDHKTTSDARKCIGAVEQIRDDIKDELDKLEDLQNRLNEAVKPYQEKLKELPEEKEEERKKIQEEANNALKPFNEEDRELGKELRELIADIEIDKDYVNYIKSIWEDLIKPKFRNTKDMLRIADSFNI